MASVKVIAGSSEFKIRFQDLELQQAFRFTDQSTADLNMKIGIGSYWDFISRKQLSSALTIAVIPIEATITED